MKRLFVKSALFVLAGITAPALIPSNASADLVCRLCPFNCEDTGARDQDCGDRYQRRNGKCCVDLDDRGLDALRETDRRRYSSGYSGGYGSNSNVANGYRPDYSGGYSWDRGDRDGGYNRPNRPNSYDNRYENEYDRRRTDPSAYDDRNGYQPGDCPTGYHVNERECNPDERRRGCHDMRSRSGQICVGWNR